MKFSKANDRLKAVTHQIELTYRRNGNSFKAYPSTILEMIVFHKFHFYFNPQEALQNYRKLKNQFVDWNEIRISSIREIQEVLGFSADSLEIAIFIKDLLEYLNRQIHSLSLEFLAEKNLNDIRSFLKGIRSLDPATIQLVLRLRKGYPVLPLTPSMELTLTRLGLIRPGETREQKGRYLHQMIDTAAALPFHHFILSHSREICPPDESQIQCSICLFRSSCEYFHKAYKRMQAPQKSSAAKNKM